MIAIIFFLMQLERFERISKRALGRRHAFDARVDLSGPIHRPGKGLEASFDDMVRILAARYVDMQVHTELIGEGSKKLVRQIGVEIAHPARADFYIVE